MTSVPSDLIQWLEKVINGTFSALTKHLVNYRTMPKIA